MTNKYSSNFHHFKEIGFKFERIQKLINNLMTTDFSQKKFLLLND